MAWGTDIMMLGRLQGGLGMAPGYHRGTGALSLGLTPSGVDIPSTAGAYVGACLGGAGIGYFAGRNPRSALAGSAAASGFWSLSEAISNARVRPVWCTSLFAALGAGSLFYAWRQGSRKR
jgi:hypothetical protein